MHPWKRWVNDSLCQFLHSLNTGQGMMMVERRQSWKQASGVVMLSAWILSYCVDKIERKPHSGQGWWTLCQLNSGSFGSNITEWTIGTENRYDLLQWRSLWRWQTHVGTLSVGSSWLTSYHQRSLYLELQRSCAPAECLLRYHSQVTSSHSSATIQGRGFILFVNHDNLGLNPAHDEFPLRVWASNFDHSSNRNDPHYEVERWYSPACGAPC